MNTNIDKDKLVYLAAALAEDKKSIDTEILDIRSLADITDYLMISSGESTAQLKAIAASIETGLSKLGLEPAHKEGKYGDKWFLLDYVDFIVHIIQEDARDFYKLEELWNKAQFIPPEEWKSVDELYKQVV